MTKMYCDRCGAEIQNGAGRSISVGDLRGYIVTASGTEVDPESTMLTKEICMSCAIKIIEPFRAEKSNNYERS